MKLVYGASADSAWNNGNERWNSLPMIRSEGRWVAEMQVDSEKVYAVYVETYCTVQVEMVDIDLYDTSLIEVVVSPYTQWCTKPDYRLIAEYIGEQGNTCRYFFLYFFSLQNFVPIAAPKYVIIAQIDKNGLFSSRGLDFSRIEIRIKAILHNPKDVSKLAKMPAM